MMVTHEEKEHGCIISLQRDEGYFCKNRTNQFVNRPKQTKMNKNVVIPILTPKKERILYFHIGLEEIIIVPRVIYSERV